MPLALILVRWLHLSASILLASLFLFEAAIVLPATRKSSAAMGHLLDTVHRLTCRTALWTLLVALMSWMLTRAIAVRKKAEIEVPTIAPKLLTASNCVATTAAVKCKRQSNTPSRCGALMLECRDD